MHVQCNVEDIVCMYSVMLKTVIYDVPRDTLRGTANKIRVAFMRKSFKNAEECMKNL